MNTDGKDTKSFGMKKEMNGKFSITCPYLEITQPYLQITQPY